MPGPTSAAGRLGKHGAVQPWRRRRRQPRRRPAVPGCPAASPPAAPLLPPAAAPKQVHQRVRGVHLLPLRRLLGVHLEVETYISRWPMLRAGPSWFSRAGASLYRGQPIHAFSRQTHHYPQCQHNLGHDHQRRSAECCERSGTACGTQVPSLLGTEADAGGAVSRSPRQPIYKGGLHSAAVRGAERFDAAA